MAEKIQKTCGNCKHNDKGVCQFIRNNFCVLTRVINDKGQNVGMDYTLQSAITITDAAAKYFNCNQWELKETKEEK